MSINLTPEQEQFLQEKLNSGKYRTIDEVITEAFHLLEQRDQHYDKWIAETKKKVAIGLEQLYRGEGINVEIVIDRLKEKINRARQADS